MPARVVVHKTSLYQPEEVAGFRRAAEARVPACDLIWMRSTAFRLIRKGTQEPWRGTLCTVGDEHYLFRSEEHTSELQSLMRISYAVFCLKKKTLINEQH